MADVSKVTFEYVDPERKQVRMALHSLLEMPGYGIPLSRATITDVAAWVRALPPEAHAELMGQLMPVDFTAMKEWAERAARERDDVVAALVKVEEARRVALTDSGVAWGEVAKARSETLVERERASLARNKLMAGHKRDEAAWSAAQVKQYEDYQREIAVVTRERDEARRAAEQRAPGLAPNFPNSAAAWAIQSLRDLDILEGTFDLEAKPSRTTRYDAECYGGEKFTVVMRMQVAPKRGCSWRAQAT